MKQTFISFRVVIPFCALLLLAQACRRDDPYHPSKPRCMIETHLVQKDNEQSPLNPPYPKPYQYTRRFGPNGLVNYAELYIIPFNPYGMGIAGEVLHAGNHVFMRSEAGDTLVRAELNRHGLPVKMIMGDMASWFPHKIFTFQYDNRNRLSRSTTADLEQDPSTAFVIKYQYDRFDNVTWIGSTYPGSEESPYTTFNYDYSRPIKGGDYEVGGMGANLPWEVVVMQLLGHLNTTQPHHIVNSTTTTHYPEGTWTYEDQKVNEDGYLVSYKVNLGGDYLKCGLIWNCGKSNGPKY